jgi:hypothetical protein
MTPPAEGPTLLVITATLGQSPWLDAGVQSVRDFAGPGHTHLLCAPRDRCVYLQDRYPHCVAAPDNAARGLYAALNVALDATRSWPWRWLTWLADDDLLRPGFAKVRAAAEAGADGTTSAAVWRGIVEMIREDGRRLCRVPHARRSSDVAALVAAGISPFNQQSLLYSRRAAEAAGPFPADFRICGDAAHWLTAWEKGAVFHHCDVVAAAFRVRAGQLSGAIEQHVAEFARLRQRAGARLAAGPSWPAVLRFRMQNLWFYAERILRGNGVTGFGLLRLR